MGRSVPAESRALFFFSCMLLALAGCSGGSPAPSTSGGAAEREAYLTQLDSILESAKDDGASQAQIDLLSSTRALGYMPFDVAHQALMNFAACLADHGVKFRELDASGPADFPRLEYIVSVYDAQGDTWRHTCDTQEYLKVDTAYQTQPRAIDARRQMLDLHRDEVLACLRDAGRPLPDDATPDEITQELYYAFFGFYPGSGDSAPSGFEGTDCLTPTGISWSDLDS